jgi:hypothetical protein
MHRGLAGLLLRPRISARSPLIVRCASLVSRNVTRSAKSLL